MYIAQSAVYRVQSTEYRVQSTEYRIQSTEYRVQSTEYRVQSTEYRVQSICTENRILSPVQCTVTQHSFKVNLCSLSDAIGRILVILSPMETCTININGFICFCISRKSAICKLVIKLYCNNKLYAFL